MPNWGLTKVQRRTRPWGLDEKWLLPEKTITDPVHGDIFLTKLEADLVNTAPMQRLRGVMQLGTTHLIYPGATHSRFSHALGTLRVSQDLMDAVISGFSGPRQTRGHLFREWEALGPIDPNDPTSPSRFDRNVAEATVLARLGGLLHDLCHIPIGHTIEDDLEILESHDGNVERFKILWDQIPKELTDVMGAELARQLRPLILSKAKVPRSRPIKVKYPFVTDIVGNTICADLMDYLRRDHLYTGLPIALGDRFVNEFYVISGQDTLRPGRMAVHIDRKGHIRHDVVTELVKYLRYRYELSERVLYHHAKIAADAMLGKALEMWRDTLWIDEAKTRHPSIFNDDNLLADADSARSAVSKSQGRRESNQIDQAVKAQVETQFLNWDDDGLLKDLRQSTKKRSDAGGPGSARLLGVSRLCDMVLNRELFKSLGRADSEADLADAKDIHDMWGAADARRKLEEDAAKFAGIDSGWKVVVWVPGPKMRPKPAEVLVERQGRVAALADMPPTVSDDAKAIVEQHRHLWGVAAYIHPEVASRLQRDAALAWLKDTTGLGFQDEDGNPAASIEDILVRVLMSSPTERVEEEAQMRELVTSSMKDGNDFASRAHALGSLCRAAGLGDGDLDVEERLRAFGWPT